MERVIRLAAETSYTTQCAMPQERQEEQGPRKRRLRWRSRTRTRTSNLLPPVKRKRLIIPVTNSVEPDTIRRRPRSLQSDRQGATSDFNSEEDPVNERSVVHKTRSDSHPSKQFLITLNDLDETKWTHIPTRSWQVTIAM
jgi:hypothetical protein